MTVSDGDRADWTREALSEALRRLEREHDERVEEMIRRFQAGPPAMGKKSPGMT